MNTNDFHTDYADELAGTAPLPPANGSARARFEQWIAAPPYERDLYRWPMEETKHAWPGQYKDIAVQLAWEAWLEASQKNEARLHWLHDCSTGQTDPEGYEWGIWRVKMENGKAVSVRATLSDMSDLDAEMERELNTPNEKLTDAAVSDAGKHK